MNKNIAEESTGIQETGLQLWSENVKINAKKAQKLLFEEQEIAVPGAGAGSYDEVFEMLGFEKVEVIEWSSSAGDWSFGVKDKTGWRLAWQENRYTYHGFRYSISFRNYGFKTFEDLLGSLRD